MEIAAGLCRVFTKEQLAPGIFSLWVDCPSAASMKAGQFVGVKCDGFTLRRPISVCEIAREISRIRLVFEARGGGTQWLAQVGEGHSLDILAPLGNGFNLGNTGRRAVFVGGGIGVPPLLEAAKPFAGNADVILGFRSADKIILDEDFIRCGSSVTVVTEDGSRGEKGLVSAPLAARLGAGPCDVVFACGPRPMLAAVAAEAGRRGIKCFVSMEERMACGVGACLSCACRATVDGSQTYLHVCKNGPVFDAERIVW